MESPAWLAVIEQFPGATRVTVEPDTVQTDVVVEANATARPELAVAVSVNAGALKARPAGALKLIVWLPLPTVKVCTTGAAAL